MLDYAKIDVFSKLPKAEAKEALLEYLNEFGVTAPKNYSFEKMVKTAETRIQEKKEEEEARELMNSESFVRTNVTPHDLLKNPDKFGIKAPKADDLGLVHPFELQKQAPLVPPRLIEAQIGQTPSKEFIVPGADIILPETFRPNFTLSMRTPDGRECTTIGYWVIDEIMKLGSMWKLGAITSKFSVDLMSLIYYIQKHGYVIVRESRHSHYIILR